MNISKANTEGEFQAEMNDIIMGEDADVNHMPVPGSSSTVGSFDELDKVSRTEHGREIIGILTHLVDPSQNSTFQDKYFTGIDFYYAMIRRVSNR